MAEKECNPEGNFEAALERALGAQMCVDETLCREVWSAMANVVWKNRDGAEASFTWRAAGGIIADILEDGDYMDWYCGSEDGVVSDRVRAAMTAEGWTPINR